MRAREPALGDDDRSVLDELPALRAMPDDVRSLVSDTFEPVSYEFGDAIVREGDDADAFYVLVSGTARVVKRTEHGEEVPLNVVHRSDSFGEMGLLGDSTRVATVRASGPATSSDGLLTSTPSSGMRPWVGLKPTTPHRLAG